MIGPVAQTALSAAARLPSVPVSTRLFALAFALTFSVCTAAAAEASEPPWAATLKSELAALDAQHRGRLGVYVRDLDTGATASHRAEQRWYLASMVKVPVAIIVLRDVERGLYSLETTVTLRAADIVDGAGTTVLAPVGTPLTVRSLLEQMVIHSDNTATDMLIGLVGLPAVNALVKSLVPEGLQRITTLGEIRRLIYGQIVPDVERLTGRDLLLLRHARSDAERLQLLNQLTGAPEGRRRPGSLDDAYDAYYASGVNSGRLDAYAELLALLFDGKALSPRTTEHLVGLMQRSVTGTDRLKAGLPSHVRLAHKTGTQRRRVCDAGLLRWLEDGRQRRALVVACTRDEPSLERAESALMQVGLALCHSGLLTQGVVDASSCPALAVGPLAVPARVPRAGPARR